MRKLLLLTIAGSFLFITAKSNIKIPIANTGQGWSAASNWGEGGIPASDDTVVIPNGFVLNVKGNIYNSGKPKLVIYIYGVLDFDPSGKIDLANFSEIHVLTGGSIKTNGSSSELISINDQIKYNGHLDGNITGPLFSDNNTGVSPNGFIPFHVLPVMLVQFSPELKNNNFQLHWTVVKETGLNNYELEGRRSDQPWTSLQNYMLTGEAGEKITNEFKQTLPTKGVYDFRLKLINQNGQVSYSKIISVNCNHQESLIKIFPNPANSNLSIKYGMFLGEGQIRLANSYGKIIYQTTITPGHSANINVSQYPKGIYTLLLNSGNENYSEMFFIR